MEAALCTAQTDASDLRERLFRADETSAALRSRADETSVSLAAAQAEGVALCANLFRAEAAVREARVQGALLYIALCFIQIYIYIHTYVCMYICM